MCRDFEGVLLPYEEALGDKCQSHGAVVTPARSDGTNSVDSGSK